jgi:hypothetical protein
VKPAVGRIVGCQRVPDRKPPVSYRIPATSMKMCVWLVQSVIHLPRPAAPYWWKPHVVSGPSSSPAAASANDTEPEQS